jgi:hypothetical protein
MGQVIDLSDQTDLLRDWRRHWPAFCSFFTSGALLLFVPSGHATAVSGAKPRL